MYYLKEEPMLKSTCKSTEFHLAEINFQETR